MSAGLIFHDSDEVGVHEGADVAWRQRTLEGWVQRALRYQRDGHDMLLTGQSPLAELIAAPSTPLLDGFAVCLLDVDDGHRCRRLEERDPGRWSTDAKRSFISWATWHRAHANDPDTPIEPLVTGSWRPMRWARWADLPEASRASTTVIDTTFKTPCDTADDMAAWVARMRDQIHSPEC